MSGRDVERLRTILLETADGLELFDRVSDVLMEASLAVPVATVSKHLDFLLAALLTTDLALKMLLFLLMIYLPLDAPPSVLSASPQTLSDSPLLTLSRN